MKDRIRKALGQFSLLSFNKRLLYSYASVIVLVLVLFAVTMYWGITNTIRGQVLTSGFETLKQARGTLTDYMADVDTLMLNVAANPTVQAALETPAGSDYEGLQAVQRIQNQFASDVFIQKTNGVTLYAAGQPYFPVYTRYSVNTPGGNIAKFGVFSDEAVAEDAWMQQTRGHTGGTLWLEPSWDEARGASEVSANRVIPSTKNLKQHIGVMRVFVPTSRFQDIVGDLSLGFSGSVFIVAGDVLIGDEATGPEQALLRQAAGQGEGIEEVVLEGEAHYLLRCPVEPAGWTMVGLISKARLMERYQFINNIIFIALILFVAVTVVFVWRISQNLSTPIRRVAGAMRDFETHPDLRLEEEESGDVKVLYHSFNRMMDRIDSLLAETRATASSRRKAELRALQAQINPHFLYNTLDCIKSLATTGATQDIAGMTTALSDFYRGSLSKGSELLLLREEVALTLSYCSVVRYRSRTPFTVETDIPEALLARPVLKLLLQPLVENAILHGFARLGRPGSILIRGREEDGALLLTVQDNGEGGDAEYLNGVLSGEYRPVAEVSRSGYGIHSVQERICLVFGPGSGLRFVENEDGGITAEMRLVGPLKGDGDGQGA